MEKKIFMLPTGDSGKKYIDETTCLFNVWVSNTPYESIALKAVQLYYFKNRVNYLKALARRLSPWNEGKIGEQLYEGQFIKGCLKALENAAYISKISKELKVLMNRGNENNNLKLLINSMLN